MPLEREDEREEALSRALSRLPSGMAGSSSRHPASSRLCLARPRSPLGELDLRPDGDEIELREPGVGTRMLLEVRRNHSNRLLEVGAGRRPAGSAGGRLPVAHHQPGLPAHPPYLQHEH